MCFWHQKKYPRTGCYLCTVFGNNTGRLQVFHLQIIPNLYESITIYLPNKKIIMVIMVIAITFFSGCTNVSFKSLVISSQSELIQFNVS